MDDDHHHSNREDSDDEENETLEESPCSRWLKRNERVDQCQVLGVDATFLAMDDEEGVEVVWSEIDFESNSLPLIDAKEDTICDIFDHLSQLNHPNISKIHKFWIRKPDDSSIDSGQPNSLQATSNNNRTTNPINFPRICIITEYTSSGTLKHFLHKTKKQMKLEAWRKWCTQMLSALCYLHACLPQIVHGNLSCDTCFISYNGLIKIGALASDAIHRTLRTHRNESRANLHFIAPECRPTSSSNNNNNDSKNNNSNNNNDDSSVSSTNGSGSGSSSITNDLSACRNLSPAADVYSFGMCALQMAALEIATDENSGQITDESIQKTIDGLDNALQRDLIRKCLEPDPNMRPTARELIFHAVIYEVPSLRLFCASSILNSCASYNLSQEQVNEEHIRKMISSPTDNSRVLADVRYCDEQKNLVMKQYKVTDLKKSDLDKFLEDVKNGGCPLTAVICTLRTPLISKARTLSPEMMNEEGRRMTTPDNPYDEETRRIVHVNCTLQNLILDPQNVKYVMKIIVKLDDKINRQLTCEMLNELFDPFSVTQELVYYGFINKEDNAIVMEILSETLRELPQGGTVNHERKITNDAQLLNGYLTQPLNIVATAGPSQMTNHMITGQAVMTNDPTQLHQLQQMPLSMAGEMPQAGNMVPGNQPANVIMPQVPLTNTGQPVQSQAGPPAQMYQDYSAQNHAQAYAQSGQIQFLVQQQGVQQPGPNLVYVSSQPGDPNAMLGQPQMVQFQPVQPPVQTLQSGPTMQFVPAIQQNVAYTQAPGPQNAMMRPELPLYPMNSYVIPTQQQPNMGQATFQTQMGSGAGTPTQGAPPLHYPGEPLSTGYANHVQ